MRSWPGSDAAICASASVAAFAGAESATSPVAGAKTLTVFVAVPITASPSRTVSVTVWRPTGKVCSTDAPVAP